ncbi:hypothetical protein KM043_002110 [Ampulex compressa]|nr:hypothetical protein KM043_002110 [Ampulex compressa]
MGNEAGQTSQREMANTTSPSRPAEIAMKSQITAAVIHRKPAWKMKFPVKNCRGQRDERAFDEVPRRHWAMLRGRTAGKEDCKGRMTKRRVCGS